MNETILCEILNELCQKEFHAYDNYPPYRPSLRHRLAMKRIFRQYERNKRKNAATEKEALSPVERTKALPKLRPTKKALLFLIAILFATFLTGWTVLYVSERFHGTVAPDHTTLFSVDTGDFPETLEKKYVLPEVPTEFEIYDAVSNPFHEITSYIDPATDRTIVFGQHVKDSYHPHYNTERGVLEDVVVNGNDGICLDLSDESLDFVLILWDCGDYVLELIGNLPKNKLMNLAESAEIS
ncbi:MAG: DUF4367 domain-containing protein [Bacteroides sp.]|nr:DUF4367 domain-containing protein [Eubacterium sp.]MCM1418677.1 DUF4367 domain-containing protein [Roseburia sp.]MCM1461981.1 DUF4367 domain-containing protein [Bacteroides sp.]